jgi:hypothetical protein
MDLSLFSLSAAIWILVVDRRRRWGMERVLKGELSWGRGWRRG